MSKFILTSFGFSESRENVTPNYDDTIFRRSVGRQGFTIELEFQTSGPFATVGEFTEKVISALKTHDEFDVETLISQK